MGHQPKTGYISRQTGATGRTENSWRNFFIEKESGSFATDRVLTAILTTLLVVVVGVTWLPGHISENLILPSEIIFLVIAIVINGRVYKLQTPFANQLIITSLVIQVIAIEVANWLFPSSILFFQYFALPFQVYRFFGDRAGLRVSIITGLVYAVHSLFIFKDLQLYLPALLAGTLALFTLTSRYRHTLRERLEQERREQ
ncbi:MAG TPA: hypothetical protein VH186_12110, partial [Chloroflexia bacterium]|nr:hypothetical protein [Chloroflexia bacterium]